jgi:hypothetical protein
MTVGIVAHCRGLVGARARSLYLWLTRRMERIGVLPDIVTLDAPGFWGVNYKTFERVRYRIDQYDFTTCRGLILTRRTVDWTSRHQHHWVTTAAIGHNPEKETVDHTHWLITPIDAGLGFAEAVRHLTTYAQLAVDHYGYLFAMPREYGPECHYMGCSGYESFTNPEEAENVGWWGSYQSAIPNQAMLRNVYPVNFLRRGLLELPVAGRSLGQWIQKDDSRGTLEPLTRTVWQWRVSPDKIPAVREALFREGVLFYYRFVQDWEPDNPWKRDFSKPFVPREPIPEIFRATYRHLTDYFPSDALDAVQ